MLLASQELPSLQHNSKHLGVGALNASNVNDAPGRQRLTPGASPRLDVLYRIKERKYARKSPGRDSGAHAVGYGRFQVHNVRTIPPQEAQRYAYRSVCHRKTL